jgi:hypothetical protein
LEATNFSFSATGSSNVAAAGAIFVSALDRTSVEADLSILDRFSTGATLTGISGISTPAASGLGSSFF